MVEIIEINDGYYDTVGDMIVADLVCGKTVTTLGFHDRADNGGACYIISDQIEPGWVLSYDPLTERPYGTVIKLTNGLYALIQQKNNELNLRQCGATGNGIDDDTKSIKSAIDSLLFFKLLITAGQYKFTEPLAITGGNNKKIIGDSNYYVPDNYKICQSRLQYHPQTENTTAVYISSTGMEMRNIQIKIMDYTKKTKGLHWRCDMGTLYNIDVVDADDVHFVLGGRYGEINKLGLRETAARQLYVDADFENRSAYAYVVTDGQDVDAGYIPTNQRVHALRIGGPTYCAAKNGVLINGYNLVFDGMFNPSAATMPVIFQKKAVACEINNSYFEYNKNSNYEYHFVFEKGSKKNKIRSLYISDKLKIKDEGLLNEWEAVPAISDLPTALGMKSKSNFYNLHFKSDGYGGVNVIDRLSRTIKTSISYDGRFSYSAISGVVLASSKNTITIDVSKPFNFGIRWLTSANKLNDQYKGKALLIGCKVTVSNDCDLDINTLAVTGGNGTYRYKDTISTVIQATDSNFYTYFSLFKSTVVGTKGSMTFRNFFIYPIDGGIASEQSPSYDSDGNFMITDSVTLKAGNGVPYRIEVDTDGALSTTRLNSIIMAPSKGISSFAESPRLVSNGEFFTFRVEVWDGYDPNTVKVSNVAFIDNSDGSYTVTNITSNKIILISVDTL